MADYESDGAHFGHANVLNSTPLTTDWSGSNSQEVLLYPFGEIWYQTPGYFVHTVFAGQQGYDPSLDTYQTPSRRFQPLLGRWMTPDLLGGGITNPQSLNRYAYVMNNPTTLTDPLGLQSGDFDPRACQDPAYADSHAECQGPGSDYCSQFPYSPECSGYPGGGRGTGGVGGGGAPAPPGPPGAGQPPLAGMGNASFPTGSNVCTGIIPGGMPPQIIIVGCGQTLFPVELAGVGIFLGAAAIWHFSGSGSASVPDWGSLPLNTQGCYEGALQQDVGPGPGQFVSAFSVYNVRTNYWTTVATEAAKYVLPGLGYLFGAPALKIVGENIALGSGIMTTAATMMDARARYECGQSLVPFSF